MLRESLSRMKLFITRYYMRFLLFVLLHLFRLSPWSRRRISLGYLTQNPKHMDGLGAQLQRVIAVRGLAKFWGLSSWQPKILKIAIHPLDGINSEDKVSEYLASVNTLIDGKALEPNQKIDYLEEIGFFAILLILLRACLSKRHIFLMISLPFKFVDSTPALYSLGACDYRERLKQHITFKKPPGVAIHHRWTIGNGIVQPGQRVSRSVGLTRFKAILDERFENLAHEDLYIFTDAPLESITFHPPSENLDVWRETAGFNIQGIEIEKLSANEIELVFPKFRVIRGGAPLETLANLSSSKVLLLSNSSFGYVAALLAENANVYLPKEFWHPPLKLWKSF